MFQAHFENFALVRVCWEKYFFEKNTFEKNFRFAIREGGRSVGSGQVTEILD